MNATTSACSPALFSWVESANAADCDFSLNNLPYGVFTSRANVEPHVGVAIGDQILDLHLIHYAGLLNLPDYAEGVFATGSLNHFISFGRDIWRSVRKQVTNLLSRDCQTLQGNASLRARALIPQTEAHMLLPVQVPGYTDFYSSKEHATNVGSMFRDPKNALLPNWLEIPIGYNGRASSVVVSGTPVTRPMGQIKGPTMERPVFAPCGKLDFELETGFIIGRGNDLGETIGIDEAESHIFGMVLLNDWSARDIQAWEYVPLGPFNAKTFATSISPWVVTMDALEPFRVMQPSQEPAPLPYLVDGAAHGFDIELAVDLQPAGSSSAHTICKTNFKHMYWSMAQQLTHHTSGGCNTRIGDLMGSGTISGPTQDSFGSLLELTWNGANPLKLDESTQRSFILDGDTVIMRGWAQGDGYRVGFGQCSGVVLPARTK